MTSCSIDVTRRTASMIR